MLQAFIGEEEFRKGLQSYLTEHSYGNARTSDLWQSMQKASSMPKSMTVADVMDTWTLQMGYPVVSVRHKPGSQHLLLSQQRFLLSDQGNHSGHPSPFNYTWKVPVTYRTKSNSDKKLVWLEGKEMALPVPLGSSDWIKFNLDVKGFYRVNYEDSLWQLIIQQLRNNHTVFSTTDRAGLLDDAFALARAGLLSYDIVFELLGYLDKEAEYLPLKTAIKGYSYIADRIYLSEAYPKLQRYMLRLLSGRLKALGWGQQNEPLNEFLQTSVLGMAMELNHEETIEKAKQLFEYQDRVPKNLQRLVVSAAVKHGDDNTWQHVFRSYLNSSVPTHKSDLLSALTYTTSPRRIQMFLQDSLNDSIVRSQDTGKVIQHFGGSDYGHIFAWRFVQEKWDKLFKRFGSTSFSLGYILQAVVAPFNTQFDYNEVSQFFQGKDVGAGAMGLRQSLEMVQSHITWIHRSMDNITRWFHDHQD